ncbi:MAG: hypothetical protein KME49_15670 [Brasilonema octagenarum HA4186-MV1]|jgi:hypothetical protein|uniref:Uncharacterized protein n=2 Tax=Brasilonema TaxID=383614 RepID=A0A856MC42_9CYAN|nr:MULTISPECIES: hypothetical protein [Brasilonema]MBW4626893.1 hypothetical protein [Brasilonema octagenarum HA4186-MV1]NMF66687.1 hypothetical protein [Brasilonema octagenarum UFV-OR1]QDL07880.1 hypothetical protein DP114_08180 [Brasilonema sennae CENA114]QDL14240.1 hypothetical protein DP113_08135 [Brasilonema octagenarum UFV-E1]
MSRRFLPPLSPDDLPPTRMTQLDELLRRQLEDVIYKHFFKACSSMIRALLSNCHWYFQIKGGTLILIIVNYDMESYWHIANAIPQMVNKLKLFSNTAKIRFCPPSKEGIPWEIAVDEISDENDVS